MFVRHRSAHVRLAVPSVSVGAWVWGSVGRGGCGGFSEGHRQCVSVHNGVHDMHGVCVWVSASVNRACIYVCIQCVQASLCLYVGVWAHDGGR